MASPITCHVLNTLSGTPAAGLHATLTLLDEEQNKPDATQFIATTDPDGRVKQWLANLNPNISVADVMSKFPDHTRIPWSIKFAVGPWYEAQGIECFWPEIEVKFYVLKGVQHYHVPVLAGPWTYTTYRGS